MIESKGIQAIVNQAAIQAVTEVMMSLRDANLRPRSATTATMR